MSVRKHTTVDSRNYYYSSFNPSKTFGTLQAAQNYERLYYLDESLPRYLKLYRQKDGTGDPIKFLYDPQLTYFYEPRVSGLQERETAQPIFYEDEGSRDNDRSFFYFLDQAKSIELVVAKESGLNLSKRTKKLGTLIKTLNQRWGLSLPYETGIYNYTKLGGWERVG